MDVVVTGSSGLIGTALRPALERAGHRMVPMLRGGGGGEALRWDQAQGRIDAGGLEGTRAGRGGALGGMLEPFKLGVGGKLGTGRQWMSWISLEDEVGAIVHLLGDVAPAGAVNLTAPNPASNADFTKALGQALGRPTVLP